MSDAYGAATALPPGWEAQAAENQKRGMEPADAQRVALAQGYMKQGYSVQEALQMATRMIDEAMKRSKPIGLQPGTNPSTMPTQQAAANPMASAMGMANASKQLTGLLGPTAASPADTTLNLGNVSGGLPADVFNLGG